MIVIDLEWNSGLYTKLRLDEILQIGAVKVDLDRRRIVDSFNAYIRPTIHKRYSPAVAQLPDLALSEGSQLLWRGFWTGAGATICLPPGATAT